MSDDFESRFSAKIDVLADQAFATPRQAQLSAFQRYHAFRGWDTSDVLRFRLNHHTGHA